MSSSENWGLPWSGASLKRDPSSWSRWFPVVRDGSLQLSFVPTAPVAPKALAFHSNSSSSLTASWAKTEGAEWLHLTLQNLHTAAESSTVSLRRGLSSYVFQHLQPGTPYRLGISAAAGLYLIEGPNVTAYTCEYAAGYCSRHLEVR